MNTLLGTETVSSFDFTEAEKSKAFSISEMAIYEYNFIQQTIKCHDNWYFMLGYELTDFPKELSTFHSLIHPKDFITLNNDIANHLAGDIHQIFDVQFRMKAKSGEWKWLRTRSVLEFDSNNKPFKWIGSITDITKIKIAENNAIQDNKHLNSVVNSLSDIIYEIDQDYTFINCWSPENHLYHNRIKANAGKKIYDVFSPTIFNNFKKIIDDTFRSKESQEIIYVTEHSKKQYLARTTLLPNELSIPHNLTMIIQDVTEVQNTKKELESKEANLRAMIQNTSDIFWALDVDKNLIIYNEAFNTLYTGISDYKPKIGHPLNDGFLLEETAKRWHLIHERSLSGMDTKFSKSVIFKSGVERLFEFHINPFRNHKNEIIGSVVTGRDIDDIYTAKKQAEKSARLKSKFISTISHEIRTPLNAILGTCHQLERNNLQDNLTDDLNILELASDNLMSLINDVLDFTKLESGKVVMKPTTFSFKEFLKAFDLFTKNLASKKELTLITEYDKNLPEFIHADKPKLHQVLTNLLSNAVKYTESGSITFSVKSVITSDRKSTYCFTVSDTGIGIPSKDIHGIFDSFTQSSTSYQLLKGGTGLGLSITKNLVDLFKGTISVDSKANEGSTFIVELPLKVSLKDHEEKGKIKSSINLKNINILVAEDNEINAKIITRLLGQWNANYDLAVNGQIATEMSMVKKYDLILMDIQMPLKNGFEASNEIKSLAKSLNQKTPIIALTAQPDFSFDPSYREGLFDGYILKPFHPTNLKENIIDFLAN